MYVYEEDLLAKMDYNVLKYVCISVLVVFCYLGMSLLLYIYMLQNYVSTVTQIKQSLNIAFCIFIFIYSSFAVVSSFFARGD